MKGPRTLKLGAVLMALLGLLRSAGGILLLTRGPAADPNIHAGGPTVAAVGAGLLVLGTILVVAAIGVFLRRRLFWRIGIACTIAFVIDGAINGTLLYGKPGDSGTMANVIMATVILICLFKGAPALESPESA
jgi:hypothetical protein